MISFAVLVCDRVLLRVVKSRTRWAGIVAGMENQETPTKFTGSYLDHSATLSQLL
jgi:hypothetical protein